MLHQHIIVWMLEITVGSTVFHFCAFFSCICSFCLVLFCLDCCTSNRYTWEPHGVFTASGFVPWSCLRAVRERRGAGCQEGECSGCRGKWRLRLMRSHPGNLVSPPTPPPHLSHLSTWPPMSECAHPLKPPALPFNLWQRELSMVLKSEKHIQTPVTMERQGIHKTNAWNKGLETETGVWVLRRISWKAHSKRNRSAGGRADDALVKGGYSRQWAWSPSCDL